MLSFHFPTSKKTTNWVMIVHFLFFLPLTKGAINTLWMNRNHFQLKYLTYLAPNSVNQIRQRWRVEVRLSDYWNCWLWYKSRLNSRLFISSVYWYYYITLIFLNPTQPHLRNTMLQGPIWTWEKQASIRFGAKSI